MKSPTIAGTVVSAKGPNASKKDRRNYKVSQKIGFFMNAFAKSGNAFNLPYSGV